jgi:hypothetical protein
MPVDKPKPGETQDQYLKYCIPAEIQAGKESDQAAAICISTYKKQEMSKLRTSQEKFTAKLKYSQDFRGINLQEGGLETACWEGYVAIGTKMLDGREVPNCVPDPNEELEAQPTIDSTYPGQGPTTASLQEQEINVFGYNTKHFSICPGAIGLFTHLQEMPMEDDTVGMIRSAAQIADNIFRIEKEVISKGVATSSELNEVELLVDDFKDLMQEIDEEVGMIHDVSFMDGHIQVVKDLV